VYGSDGSGGSKNHIRRWSICGSDTILEQRNNTKDCCKF
jgi:hypothetical protein